MDYMNSEALSAYRIAIGERCAVRKSNMHWFKRAGAGKRNGVETLLSGAFRKLICWLGGRLCKMGVRVYP